MKTKTRKRLTMKCTLLVALSIYPTGMFGNDSAAHARGNDFPTSTPLWVGPYEVGIDPDFNMAYPDTGAVYWSAKCTIPEGAVLELLCKYAHARYISINSYDPVSALPTDALNDTQIVPDPGSRNPFLPGALPAGEGHRDFTITILNQFPPEDPDDRLPNTLYARAGDQGEVALVWRIYVPDKNRDVTGGVGLPEPRVTLASGEALDVEDSYTALSPYPNRFPLMTMDPATYAFLRSGSAYVSDLWPEFPA